MDCTIDAVIWTQLSSRGLSIGRHTLAAYIFRQGHYRPVALLHRADRHADSILESAMRTLGIERSRNRG